jgi:hypothetical protein
MYPYHEPFAYSVVLESTSIQEATAILTAKHSSISVVSIRFCLAQEPTGHLRIQHLSRPGSSLAYLQSMRTLRGPILVG